MGRVWKDMRKIQAPPGQKLWCINRYARALQKVELTVGDNPFLHPILTGQGRCHILVYAAV